MPLDGGVNSYLYVGGNPVKWVEPLGFIRGLDEFSRGTSTAGQEYAKSITEGGTGTAYAGHGSYRFGDGKIIVPPGTSVTLPREGITIWDETGRYIELEIG